MTDCSYSMFDPTYGETGVVTELRLVSPLTGNRLGLMTSQSTFTLHNYKSSQDSFKACLQSQASFLSTDQKDLVNIELTRLVLDD